MIEMQVDRSTDLSPWVGGQMDTYFVLLHVDARIVRSEASLTCVTLPC